MKHSAHPTHIDGVYLVENQMFFDHRGYFQELYNATTSPSVVHVTGFRQVRTLHKLLDLTELLSR